VELGALRILAKPIKLSVLMQEIRTASLLRPQGIVQGLALSSLLQLLNWERKTATLTVHLQERVGYLYVKDGELIHAACGQEEGLPAAYRILGWDGARVEFVSTCRVQPTMGLPVPEVLLNVAMRRDHQDQAQAAPKPQEPWYD
jgi:hypothetical protein